MIHSDDAFDTLFDHARRLSDMQSVRTTSSASVLMTLRCVKR